MTISKSKWLVTAVLIVAALVSIFVLRDVTSSPDNHRSSIQYLQNKEATALGLTGAAVASSVAVTMIPDDVGTPVAEELAQLTDIFGISLVVILLEKYLLSLSGYIAFGFLIPFALLLIILYIHTDNKTLSKFAVKILLFSVILYSLVPTSLHISSIIEKSYSISYEETIQSANMISDKITEGAEILQEEEEAVSEDTAAAEETEDSEEQGFFSSIASGISDVASGVADTVVGGVESIGNAAGSILSGAKELLDIATTSLNKLLEAAAAMIVTTCVIPILTLGVLLWLTKMLLGINVTITSLPLPMKRSRKENDLPSVRE